MEVYVNWMLSNFDICAFVLAILFILLNRLVSRLSEPEIIYRWIALFALGFTGIYTFFMHAFFPAMSAAVVGWTLSPFQWEVAMADLAFGVLGVLSFNASYGFRLATVIGSTFWLWGDAAGHFYQIIKFHDVSSGNAGSWLWMDILVPLILIICLCKLKPTRRML